MLQFGISDVAPVVLHGAAGGIDELLVYGAAGLGLLIVAGVVLLLRRGKLDDSGEEGS